jgi:hypothetical protein
MTTEAKTSSHLWEFNPNEREAWDRRYLENPSLYF